MTAEPPVALYSYPTTNGPYVEPFEDLVIGLGGRGLATAYVEVGAPVCSYLDMARRLDPRKEPGARTQAAPASYPGRLLPPPRP